MKALEIVKTAGVLTPGLKAKIDSMLPSNSPVDHLANLINTVNAEAKALKAQEAALAGQRKSLELLVQMAESSVMEQMHEEGLSELPGQLVIYKFKLNPHKLVIDDESLIPDLYKREVKSIEIRKDAIKDELKMGSEIPGCRITQDVSLQLTTNKG